MRNIFILLCVALSLTFVQCDTNNPNETTAKFELTSDSVINVPSEGGIYTISYSLVTEEVNPEVKVFCDNTAMVTAVNADSIGYVRICVSANEDTESRSATLLVSYNAMCFEVEVVQEASSSNVNPEVVSIEADQFVGNYYGETLGSGIGHYWIILSDGGFEADGSAKVGGEFFRVELIGPAASDPENALIPDGVYRYDMSNSLLPYSILNLGNSDYTVVDEYLEGWATAFVDATLTVEGRKFILEACTESAEFYVTYEGDYTLQYNRFSDVVSNLKSDLEIDLSDCVGSVKCYGDSWKCGYCNWYVLFENKDGWNQGVYMTLELLTDTNLDGSSGFEGKYVAGGVDAEDKTLPLFGPYSFVSGHRMSNEASYLLGTLYQRYVGGSPVEETVMRGGEIEIKANGDGTHTIIINATDDAEPAHNITLNWTGVLSRN